MLKTIPALLFVLTCVMGCSNSLDMKPIHLGYIFADQSEYRVDAVYETLSQLSKSYNNKIFSKKEDKLFIRSTYNLSVARLSEQEFKARYHLQRISLHDQNGNFKMEVGPNSGTIEWYEKQQTLETYLGKEMFKQYFDQIKKPIAEIIINQRGEQLKKDDTGKHQTRIDMRIIELLSKNRVIGKKIIKAIKIPPVLMTIFPDHMIKTGERWTYQGGDAVKESDWQQTLQTQFQLKGIQAEKIIIDYKSKMDFKSEELKNLGNQLGLDKLDSMDFEKGYFKINGNILFLPEQGRPHSGNMQIEKHYGFSVGQEEWVFLEKESHEFNITIIK